MKTRCRSLSAEKRHFIVNNQLGRSHSYGTVINDEVVSSVKARKIKYPANHFSKDDSLIEASSYTNRSSPIKPIKEKLISSISKPGDIHNFKFLKLPPNHCHDFLVGPKCQISKELLGLKLNEIICNQTAKDTNSLQEDARVDSEKNTTRCETPLSATGSPEKSFRIDGCYIPRNKPEKDTNFPRDVAKADSEESAENKLQCNTPLSAPESPEKSVRFDRDYFVENRLKCVTPICASENPNKSKGFNEDYERMEQMYKANISRLTEELKLYELELKVRDEMEKRKKFESCSMPNINNERTHDESNIDAYQHTMDSLQYTQMKRTQNDQARIIVQLRDQVACLRNSEKELLQKLSDSCRISEMAKMSQIKSDLTCKNLVNELKSTHLRFEDALQEHSEEHQRKLNDMLLQSDRRLECARATLLISESKAAEAEAKAERAEVEASELRSALSDVRSELRDLREISLNGIENPKTMIKTLNFKIDQKEKELQLVKDQMSSEADQLADSVKTLKLQLRDSNERADKAETAVLAAKECEIRFLTKTNSLEQQLRIKNTEISCAIRQYSEQIEQISTQYQSRESELLKSNCELTKLHEEKMGQASRLIDQQRKLILKLKDECKNGASILNSTVGELERKQKIMQERVRTAEGIANRAEEERLQLQVEIADHVHRFRAMNEEITELEEKIYEKNSRINSLESEHISLRKDLKILTCELEFLRQHLKKQYSGGACLFNDRLIQGSFEVKEILSRISA